MVDDVHRRGSAAVVPGRAATRPRRSRSTSSASVLSRTAGRAIGCTAATDAVRKIERLSGLSPPGCAFMRGLPARRRAPAHPQHHPHGHVRPAARDRGDEARRRHELVHPRPVHARGPGPGPARRRPRRGRGVRLEPAVQGPARCDGLGRASRCSRASSSIRAHLVTHCTAAGGDRRRSSAWSGRASPSAGSSTCDRPCRIGRGRKLGFGPSKPWTPVLVEGRPRGAEGHLSPHHRRPGGPYGRPGRRARRQPRHRHDHGQAARRPRSGRARALPRGRAHRRGGRAVAAIRRHRIVERFLADMLGYAWNEADRLAGVVRARPAPGGRGPHLRGPRPAGHLPARLPDPGAGDGRHPGHAAAVRRSSPATSPRWPCPARPTRGRRLPRHARAPAGVHVEVKEKHPFDGPLVLPVDGQDRTLGATVANQVFVLRRLTRASSDGTYATALAQRDREAVEPAQDDAAVPCAARRPAQSVGTGARGPDRHLALEPGQRGAEAVVHAAAERHVLAGVGPAEVELRRRRRPELAGSRLADAEARSSRTSPGSIVLAVDLASA